MTTANMITALTKPFETSATSTATAPEAIAPTTGTKEVRNTSRVMGMTSGTPRKAAPMPMPMASTAATRICTRTYWTSVVQPRCEAPVATGRAGIGSSFITQRKMFSPS